MKLVLEIHALPRLPNTLLGAHWRVRSSHAKKWKRLVGYALLTCGEPIPYDRSMAGKTYPYPCWNGPMKKARITFTRCSPRSCDYDGLVGSFKCVADSLVHHGVIVDDSPAHVTCEYRHEKVPRTKQGIRICVEGVE